MTHQYVQAVDRQDANQHGQQDAIHIARVGKGAGHGQHAGADGCLQKVRKGLPVAVEQEDIYINSISAQILRSLTWLDSSDCDADADRSHPAAAAAGAAAASPSPPPWRLSIRWTQS